MEPKATGVHTAPHYLVLRLALIGGVVTIIGDHLIRWSGTLFVEFLQYFFMDDPKFFFPPILPSFTRVLLDFLAGFLAVHILAPFAIRRAENRPESQRRSIATGYEALCGVLACLLVAFLHLSIFFVVPTIVRDGWTKLEWGLQMYATYLRVAIMMAGLPAAVIGALAGRLAERMVPPLVPAHPSAR